MWLWWLAAADLDGGDSTLWRVVLDLHLLLLLLLLLLRERGRS
jgi:hypothetical protein